jgi:hypothetical protein
MPRQVVVQGSESDVFCEGSDAHWGCFKVSTPFQTSCSYLQLHNGHPDLIDTKSLRYRFICSCSRSVVYTRLCRMISAASCSCSGASGRLLGRHKSSRTAVAPAARAGARQTVAAAHPSRHGSNDPNTAPSSSAANLATSRRGALQQQLAALAALGASLGGPLGPAQALTVADVTPAVAASPPLPEREQAIVNGGCCSFFLCPVSHAAALNLVFRCLAFRRRDSAAGGIRNHHAQPPPTHRQSLTPPPTRSSMCLTSPSRGAPPASWM